MKVLPVASPHAIQPTGAQTSAQGDARARAIAKLTATPAAPQQPSVHSPQLNQNAIAPEDMSAIQRKPVQQDSNLEAETQEVQETKAPSEPPSSASKPEQDATSQEWARLARQEKILRQKAQQQEQAIKAREAALAAKEAELLGKSDQYKDYIPKSQLKQDALRLLAEAGVSYEELTQQILNQTPTDPRIEAQLAKMQAKLEEQERIINESKKAQSDQEAKAYQAALNQIKQDATKLVNSDPNFETIKATGSVDDVVELIERVYKKDGYVMDVAEAAEEVENYLMEEAERILKINKIKQKYVPQAQAAPAQKPQSEPQQQPTMKTLTNANTSARSLSAKERAILAFRGELK